MKMWGKSASAPIHLTHTGFGIGRIIGPLMVAPFLPKGNYTGNKTWDNAKTNKDVFVSTFQKHQNLTNQPANIKFPFITIATYSCLIAIVFCAFGCFPFIRYQQSETSEQDSNSERESINVYSPASCADGNKIYGIYMIVMLFFSFVLFVGNNCCIVTFLQPTAVNTLSLKFTLQEADLLITVFFICFTAGRIITSLISKYIPIQVSHPSHNFFFNII